MPRQPRQPSTLAVGLDLAGNRWHAVASNGMLAHCGPLEGASWKDADDRRQRLYEDAKTFFAMLPNGSHVFCEEPMVSRNGETTLIMAKNAGAIWAAHLEFDLYWYWVNISAWKKAVVGNGNASKDDIAAFVNNLGIEYPEQDYYDAHCIRGWGIRELELVGIQVLKAG